MNFLHPSTARTPKPGEVGSRDDRLQEFKRALHQKLIAAMNLVSLGTLAEAELRREIRRVADDLCRQNPDMLTSVERERIIGDVLDEVFGLGPLEALMRDPAVSDILINGPKTVYIERDGKLELAPITFHDDHHLLQIVQRMVSRVGRRVDESTPLVDARLPDGSRVNAVIAPLALDGTLVSIRRFGTRPLQVDGLIRARALTEPMAAFLAGCIRARLNVLISGGTGSGKTTLLNALSAYIPATQRVATIEDAAELRLQQRHVVRMETRSANVEGRGEITTRDLVKNALRMRPDRIIVGECRGPEALDMLQAMNTGHDGSMTTIHANGTQDALSRLELMVGTAGFDLPMWTIRRQIASAIHIVVQVARQPGGQRKVVKISELTGMEGEFIALRDIFGFEQTGVDESGVACGHFYAAGGLPHCLDRLQSAGIALPASLFERESRPG